MALISTTGVTVTLDETSGLQNATITPTPSGDADDNDILVTLTSPPPAFSDRLTTLLGDTSSAETLIETALSGYNGSNTGENAFTIMPTAGGTITDIRFTDIAGALLDGVDSDLTTADGVKIYLYTDTANNNILLGRAAGTTADPNAPNPNGAIVFAAYIEETGSPASGGKIWTTLYQPLHHDDPADHDDSVDLTGKVFIGTTQDTEFSLAGAPSGQNLFLMFTTANPTVVDVDGVNRITDVAIIATGKEPANQSGLDPVSTADDINIATGDRINTSQAGGPTTFGTNSQMITEQEGIRFTFVTGARQNVTIPNLDQNEADVEANIDFTAVFGARTATFDVVQLQSGKSAQVKISAFSTAAEPGVNFIDGYENDDTIPITNVRVINIATGQVIENSDGSVNDPSIGITFADGVASVTGVLAGYKIEYTTTADHNRVLVENGAALNARGNDHADFDIGAFRLVQVSTQTAEIGSKIVFEDDGPSISTTGTEPTLTVDETVLITDATASFAANFTSAFGEDKEGTLTYALGVVAGASGLTDTATGEAVNLSLTAGGVVEGRTASNALVFTVSVAANGDVTLDQLRAVVHLDTANHDDSTSLTADNLVTLTATITDKDGDSAQATLDIGQNLVFKDDGPSISTTGTEPTLTVDETVLITDATASFAANFTSAFGEDKEGTLTYALGVVAGASGLTDTATGEAVNLSLTAGGVVEGRTASNALVFTVSVAANGDVKLDQLRAVVHADATNPNDSTGLTADNLVTLTATITDKEGDSAQATLNIGQNLNFEDDGPTASAVLAGGAVAHDETAGVQGDANDTTAAAVIALFSAITNPSSQMAAGYAQGSATVINSSASVGGEDGLASTAYSLAVSATGVDSGLDTVDGQNILLYKEGALVVGRIGSSSGAAAFAVSIDATSGVLSMAQYNAIKHPTGGASSPDESLSIASTALLAVTTVTDGDGDTNEAQVGIGASVSFQDDGPSVAFGNLVGTGTILPQTGYWTHSTGNDGFGASALDISLTGFTLVRPDNSTTPGMFTFDELVGSPDGSGNFLFSGTLTGDFDNNASTADTEVDFSLTAYADGHYTLDLVQGFESTVVSSTASGALKAGGPNFVQTFDPTVGNDIVFFSAKALAPAGSPPTPDAGSILAGIGVGANDPTEVQIETTPLPSYIGTSGMNVSTSGIGVGDNQLDGSGTAAIEANDESFVVNPGGLFSYATVTLDNSVSGYKYTPGPGSGGNERLYYTAYYDDGSNSGPLLIDYDISTTNSTPTSFIIPGVSGKLVDAIQLTMASGAIKVQKIEFTTQTESLANDVKLDFSATVTDGDGDQATDVFSVDLYANEVANSSFDFILSGASSEQDAFNIDLASGKSKYQVTSGFEVGADKLVFLGTVPTSVTIDNSGANSIVSILEAGGAQTTTVTVVGVDLSNTDIAYG